MFHLRKHAVLQWSFFETLTKHEKDTLLSLIYGYTKPQQDQSWLNVQAAWTTMAEKSPHAQKALVKSLGACKSLAAVHQPIGSMSF
jgi:hypothetical protein